MLVIGPVTEEDLDGLARARAIRFLRVLNRMIGSGGIHDAESMTCAGSAPVILNRRA